PVLGTDPGDSRGQLRAVEAGLMDEFMDATVQISAYGLTAGCTLCLDNVPNQLAVLGHFRAMLEMCQNQIEGDPEQEDSWHEVDTQLRLVKLMIKVAQGRRKATKVEVLPCILSTSFKHGSEVSSDVASPVSRSQNRGRRLPKIEPDGPVQEDKDSELWPISATDDDQAIHTTQDATSSGARRANGAPTDVLDAETISELPWTAAKEEHAGGEMKCGGSRKRKARRLFLLRCARSPATAEGGGRKEVPCYLSHLIPWLKPLGE
ncbi:unnamed protein product, partial [Effrenium voratum]